MFRDGEEIPAPPGPPSSAPQKPPVPVCMGVHSPSDGDEQPRDKSCLQGQLKGDSLGDNRDLRSPKNHVKSPVPPLGTANLTPLQWPSKISH